MYELVIFDNDGVLVDSEPIACSVLAELLTELGVPTTYEQVLDRYLGGAITRTRTMVEHQTGGKLPAFFEDAFHDRLFDRLDHELRPVQGIEAVIDGLDVPYCVASSGTPERVRRSLATAGLLDRFDDRIFSAVQVLHGKPAPDLFLLAASVMKIDPSRCVVVEDSPLGIAAANAAGMFSIGFASLTPAERLQEANAGIVRTMSELADFRRYLGAQVDRTG